MSTEYLNSFCIRFVDILGGWAVKRGFRNWHVDWLQKYNADETYTPTVFARAVLADDLC